MLLYIQTGTGFVYNLERTLLAQVCLPDNRLYGELDACTLHCIDSNPRSFNHNEGGFDFNKSEARRFEQYACVPVFAHCSELWMTMRTFAAPLMIFSVHLIAAPALT